MVRGYQKNYSDIKSTMFDTESRRRKAITMIKVISDYTDHDISTLSVLNVGGSTGIIDDCLSQHFKQVISIDIDEKAVTHAQENFLRDNLHFTIGDAMKMPFSNEVFDVIICSQVYEHIPNAADMMDEMHRVLNSQGIVYFAATNRLVFNEPHYNLPLLSVMPRPLAHLYMRIFNKGSYYYEKHFSYWGLKHLTRKFSIIDYTKNIIQDPIKYQAGYLIPPGSKKQRIASFIAKYILWLVPGYIWILRKN